jgi:hypothetical protein
MAIETYYVKAKSKKAVNFAISKGETVIATKFTSVNITELKEGDVIKIYDKLVDGSPCTKAYGNWSTKKQQIK